jgi:hypothetical protein
MIFRRGARSDEEPDRRSVGERHVDVCRQLGCEYDLPSVPCDGCEDRYRDDDE